ncbi:MAG: hypothetical protein HKN68_09700 [Saprospiraceae bacterium]|nr:hypothetical protein [Saprospiraceae bacterium]
MDSSTPIVFLTRHYPPNPNINGESILDLVAYLQNHHKITSTIITTKADFTGGNVSQKAVGNVISFNQVFKGNNKLTRLLNMLIEGYRLVSKAKKFKNSLIIVTSSPPLLLMWASLRLKKNYRWAFWAFDLFPEGFYVEKNKRKKSFLYRILFKFTYKYIPEFLITLGPKQAEYLKIQYGSEIEHLNLPCGIFKDQIKDSNVPNWHRNGRLIFGYCGRLGEAHNPEFLKQVIDHINPNKHLLILVLYGTHSEEILKYANGRKGITIIDRVPRNQLHFIDVHLASLREEWTHIAVPSKAVSAISIGSTFLFCGSKSSDNWHLLKKCGWIIEENRSIHNQVKEFFETINMEEIKSKRSNSQSVVSILEGMVSHTYESVAIKVK